MHAAEIPVLDVSKKDSRVLVRAELLIDAPPDKVYRALINFNNFSSWSQRFKYSAYLEPAADGRPRARNDIEGCILFFCKTVVRTLTLTLQPSDYIRADADPELSDVVFGREEWWISAGTVTGESVTRVVTKVIYEHEVEFDFWVPPVIGTWAIKRELKKDGLRVARIIEDM